ncbi:MAG: hypothetical protein QNK22_02375 [Xanthomonadales bacterium]|nr:hypothetical protein [Xanthomonadales bacterium]
MLCYADSRQEERARNLLPVTCYLLPVIVKEYWDIKPQAQAEQAMREAMGELTDIRREFKLPLACTT